MFCSFARSKSISLEKCVCLLQVHWVLSIVRPKSRIYFFQRVPGQRVVFVVLCKVDLFDFSSKLFTSYLFYLLLCVSISNLVWYPFQYMHGKLHPCSDANKIK